MRGDLLRDVGTVGRGALLLLGGFLLLLAGSHFFDGRLVSSFEEVKAKLVGRHVLAAGPVAPDGCGSEACADHQARIYRVRDSDVCFAAPGFEFGDGTAVIVADGTRLVLLQLGRDWDGATRIAEHAASRRPCAKST